MTRPPLSHADLAEIQGLAQAYFHALYHGDADRFAQIFHPDARLYTHDGNGTVVLDVPSYLDIVAGREAPAASQQRRDDEILAIARMTARTAHLRVRESFFTKRFTDELVLLKAGDGWKIVAKVWDAEEMGDAT